MTQRLIRVMNFVICSGIITGSSYITVLYLQNELKNIFVQAISRVIASPENSKKFEALSEKMLKRMLEDQRNLFKLSRAVVKIIKKRKFKRHTALSITRPFNDEEIVRYLGLFMEISFYSYMKNYNIHREDSSIVNE